MSDCEVLNYVLLLLSWYMGADALHSNGITKKLLYLIRDKTITSKQDPLNKVRKSRILLFVGVQLLGFGATFAITQTVGKFLVSLFFWLTEVTDWLFADHFFFFFFFFLLSFSGDRFSGPHHAAFAYSYTFNSSHVFHKRRVGYPWWSNCIGFCK